jgi:predicted phage tail component-like protein
MYIVKRNGKTNTEVGILVKERPAIPAPEYKYETVEIPGRDGSLYSEESSVDDITIKITFAFACKPSKWQDLFRKARRWLLSKEDDQLILGDMSDHYYKVKHTVIGSSEREVKQVGEFEAEFTCDGYQYLDKGQREYEKDEALYNPYYVSHPAYYITGNGKCTLRVNGYDFTAEVGQNVTIDTDRMIAYRKDGRIMNTSVTGDYQELYLQEGDNTIEITEGFSIKIRPNWRCL